MNFYQFHVGDYVLHTAHLSLMEDLAYRRLIDLYYASEAPISLDVERTAKIIRMQDHLNVVIGVLAEFFVKSDDGYHSKRCDEELAKYREMSEGGKRGAAKRWGNRESCPPYSPPIAPLLPPQCPPQTPPNANQEPVTNKKQKQRASLFDPLSWLLEKGVDKQIAEDFLQVRRKAKAPDTITAFEGILKEAVEGGFSFNEVIRVCAKKSWRSFERGWTHGLTPIAKQNEPRRPAL